MKVFVNAISIREGGPRVVLLKLLAGLIESDGNLQIEVAAPPEMCAELSGLAVATLPVVVGQSPLAIAKWYELDLPAAAGRWAADVVFSVTNYLPVRRLSIPALLLEQHAGHFSPVFDRLMRAASVPVRERLTWDLRRRWVHRSVETATVLTVQTAALADAVAAVTRVTRDRIWVIPHGPGWVERRAEASLPVGRGTGPFRIGYVAKSGVQKNFTTLFRSVGKLADRGRSVRLVLTLDPAEPLAAATLAEADSIGISGLIDNHGEVEPQAIAGIYDSLDVFAFPSLCESFGIPMVEAMARGLCMVVADTPENREIVGPAGVTFPMMDADGLATLLGEFYDDDARRRAYARMSLKRAQEFSWRDAAMNTLAALRAAADVN